MISYRAAFVLLTAGPLAGCQGSGMNMTSDAVLGNSPAGIEMMIAEVRSRNPDRAELCSRGLNYIRHEVTTVATELVVGGRLSMSVVPDGARATQTIYGDCLG